MQLTCKIHWWWFKWNMNHYKGKICLWLNIHIFVSQTNHSSLTCFTIVIMIQIRQKGSNSSPVILIKTQLITSHFWFHYKCLHNICRNKRTYEIFIYSIITYIYFHYLGLLQSLIPFIRCRRERVLGAGGMDFDAKREYKVRHSHTISMFHILFFFIYR